MDGQRATVRAMVEAATRESHRANDRALSVAGSLALVQEELRRLARVDEDPAVDALVRKVGDASATAEAVVRRTNAIWSELYEMGRWR